MAFHLSQSCKAVSVYLYVILHIHIICYTYTRQNTVCIFHATHIIWLIICYVIFQNKGVQGAREPMTGNLDLHEPCLLFAVEVRGKRLSSSKACGQQTWSIPSPAKVPLSTREYPFAKGREGTKVSHAPGGNARNSRPRSGPWKQCERLQSDEMNDTSWYFQFTRCFRQSNGAKVDIEMSRSPSSIERYRTYQYSYNDNQWQMTANSWRWHVSTLQAKPSHEIKLAAQQCFCNMSSRCLRQLWEQAAQQSSQPRVMILSLLDLGLRWFLRSWSENDQDGTARNLHFEQGKQAAQFRRLTTSFELLATLSRSIEKTFLQSSGTERSSTSTVMTSFWFQLPATKEEFRNDALEWSPIRTLHVFFGAATCLERFCMIFHIFPTSACI